MEPFSQPVFRSQSQSIFSQSISPPFIQSVTHLTSSICLPVSPQLSIYQSATHGGIFLVSHLCSCSSHELASKWSKRKIFWPKPHLDSYTIHSSAILHIYTFNLIFKDASKNILTKVRSQTGIYLSIKALNLPNYECINIWMMVKNKG